MAVRRSFCRIASIPSSTSISFLSRTTSKLPRSFASSVAISAISRPALSSFRDNKRWYSSDASGIPEKKLYMFDDVNQLIKSPNKNVVLIDVREPTEYAAGYIPTAINIPIQSQPEALFLPPDEFQDRFGFQKPDSGPDAKEVIFYCKAGIRSRAAVELAKMSGYVNIGEYSGSWLDWERNGGEAAKPDDKKL